MALVLGTAAGDFLTAGNDGDEIRGLAGNDTILGGEGTDTLNGNEGQDLVVGRFGADRVYGGQGNDTVVATAGGMIVNGNKGDDLVIGFGNSTVFGGQANDTIYGAEGTANGDLGADLIFGGATMNGGGDPDPDSGVPAGNDTLVGSRGNNTMTGGRGNDQFVFQPEVVKTFNLTFERPIFGNIAGANQVTVTEGGYGGADVITDFAAGPGDGDIVKLVALDLGSTVTIEQVGADVRIRITNATTSPDGLGANSSTNQSANQDITIRNVNIQDFLAVGSNDLEINGEIVNVATPGLAVVNVNNNNSFRFTVRARQGRNIDLSRTGIIGTRLDADFAPDGVPFPSVNNDTIVGTQGNDVIAGLAGNDSIRADSGNDTVFGNAGDDTILGRGGVGPVAVNVPVSPDNAPFTGSTISLTAITDVIYGDFAPDTVQAGNDVIFGDGAGSSNEGPDFIDAGPGNDSVSGNGGDDIIFGGAGNDTLSGDGGNDTIYGGGGNDSIRGNDGNDTLFGGDGNDTLNGDNGNDSIQGNAGNDYVEGDDGDDTIQGNEGNDTIYGGAGNDSIQGNAGADALDGGTGFDTVSYADFTVGVTATLPEPGFTSNVTISGDVDVISDFEAITGGSGDDNLTGNSGNNTLAGGAGNDQLSGAAGNDILLGGDGNDLLRGGPGTDVLVGGAGDDILEDSDGDLLFGGPGNDIYIVSGPNTIISENNTDVSRDVVRITGGGNYADPAQAPTPAGITIPAEAGAVTPNRFANIEVIELATGAAVTLPGGIVPLVTIAPGAPAGVNITFAGAGPITFASPAGVTGNDVIVGTAGADTIDGGAGNDVITGGLGSNQLSGGSGADIFNIVFQGTVANSAPFDTITDFSLAQGDRINLLVGGATNNFASGGAAAGTTLRVAAENNQIDVAVVTVPGVIPTPLPLANAATNTAGVNAPFGFFGRPIYFYDNPTGRLLVDANGVAVAGTTPTTIEQGLVLVAQLPAGLAPSGALAEVNALFGAISFNNFVF